MPGFRPESSVPAPALTDAPSLTAAANQAVALARAGDPRAGLALVRHVRQEARGLALRRSEAEALNAAAMVHALRWDVIAAVAAGIDAHEIANEVGDRSLATHALVSLAHAASELGLRDEARRAHAACIRQAVETGDRELEVRARTGLGIVLGDVGEFDAAGPELCRALILAERYHVITCPSRALSNLANFHRKRARTRTDEDREARDRDVQDGESLAERALELAQERGNLSVQIDALAIRGWLAELQGDLPGALEHFQASCRHATRTRSPIAWVLGETGRIHLALGDADSARRHWQEMLDIATDLRPSTSIAVACNGLARVERSLGNEVGDRRWSERAAEESQELERIRAQTRRVLETFFTVR
ncbi:hypothetical protein DSM104443_00793 [Usitatibacter rugosus]|uniref:Tetratricopeptide repeat protein n=1 Tax=Usitatibacter rugosus TaxID=2732067 RepID=A0A6M4GTU8_9PROT|nr:hypothetical protein [Usitatibacter rugosus]QJR09743.1 hypothetical protein DSM104443_00793 [Usitatibacter rugosus]